METIFGYTKHETSANIRLVLKNTHVIYRTGKTNFPPFTVETDTELHRRHGGVLARCRIDSGVLAIFESFNPS